MKNSVKTIKSRLFRVADELNADGCFDLQPFDNEEFNADVDGNFYDNGKALDAIDGLLNRLLRYLFGEGGGEYFFIDFNDVNRHYDGLYSIDEVNVHLHFIERGDEIVILNIIDEIDADPETSVFFVLVSEDRTEHVWIVAQKQESVSQDAETSAVA